MYIYGHVSLAICIIMLFQPIYELIQTSPCTLGSLYKQLGGISKLNLVYSFPQSHIVMFREGGFQSVMFDKVYFLITEYGGYTFDREGDDFAWSALCVLLHGQNH